MKYFLLLPLLLVACKSNAPMTEVDKQVQLDCEQDYTHCVNLCHHIGGPVSEQYGCTQSCKEHVKKCGK